MSHKSWHFLWVITKYCDLNDCWKNDKKWKWSGSRVWIAWWLFWFHNSFSRVMVGHGRPHPSDETVLARITLIVISLIIIFSCQCYNWNKIIPFIIFSFFFAQLMNSFKTRFSTKSFNFDRVRPTRPWTIQALYYRVCTEKSCLMMLWVLSDLRLLNSLFVPFKK